MVKKSQAEKENDKKADDRPIMDQDKTEPTNSLESREPEQPVTLKEAKKGGNEDDRPVKLSVKETEQVEDSGEKRHGVAPTTGNIVEAEEDAYRKNSTGLETNGNANNEEMAEEDQKKLEKDLSKDGYVARVITSVGDYMKVKFFKNGKLFTTYKGKQGSTEDAKLWLDEARDRQEHESTKN